MLRLGLTNDQRIRLGFALGELLGDSVELFSMWASVILNKLPRGMLADRCSELGMIEAEEWLRSGS